MEMLYFTLAAVLLYLGADWILNRIEVMVDRRFEYRSIIFFAILLVMALSSFALIRHLSSQ
jgi:DMSO/TMAO reductase YedYZ heme-binding membrane subunit